MGVWVSTLNLQRMSVRTIHAPHAYVVVTHVITRVITALVSNNEVSSASVANEVLATGHVPLAMSIYSILMITRLVVYEGVAISAFH